MINSTAEIISHGKETFFESFEAEPETIETNPSLNSASVHKLKLQESVRANLARRAISIDDEEELSWDVEDEDDGQEGNDKLKGDQQGNEESVSEGFANVAKQVAADANESGDRDSPVVSQEVSSNRIESSKQDSAIMAKQVTSKDNESLTFNSCVVDEREGNQSNADTSGNGNVAEESRDSECCEKEDPEANSIGEKNERIENYVDVGGSEGKVEQRESVKSSDVSIVSCQMSGADEEELSWDEIEDIEGDDDKKSTSHVASSNGADVRKRVSVAEDV